MFSSSVGDRNAAFDRAMELRIRLDCFSSSDCGFEPLGATEPRLSSVGRCNRLAGESACCDVEAVLTVEIGLEEKEVGRDCEMSRAGGRGADLEGGVKERDGTGDVPIVGGVGAGLDGGETEELARGSSVVGGNGAALEGAKIGELTRSLSVVGGIGAALEGGETEAFPLSSSFFGTGAGLVGGAIVEVFSADGTSFAGGDIFPRSFEESSALASGVPHLD
jgi:hypothetical protein